MATADPRGKSKIRRASSSPALSFQPLPRSPFDSPSRRAKGGGWCWREDGAGGRLVDVARAGVFLIPAFVATPSWLRFPVPAPPLPPPPAYFCCSAASSGVGLPCGLRWRRRKSTTRTPTRGTSTTPRCCAMASRAHRTSSCSSPRGERRQRRPGQGGRARRAALLSRLSLLWQREGEPARAGWERSSRENPGEWGGVLFSLRAPPRLSFSPKSRARPLPRFPQPQTVPERGWDLLRFG